VTRLVASSGCSSRISHRGRHQRLGSNPPPFLPVSKGLDGRGTATASRGGGTQLAFHSTPGHYETDTLIEVLSELRLLGGEDHPGVGWRARPSQHRDVGLVARQL
jgi:hypothetical protein